MIPPSRAGRDPACQGAVSAGDDHAPRPARSVTSLDTENVPGLVFEEVTVKAVDRQGGGTSRQTYKKNNSRLGAPPGRVARLETFGLAYRKFFTSSGGDLGHLALAVPTDALDSPVPAELEALSATADTAFGRRAR